MATYTKLKSGDWGIRSEQPIMDGQTVTVRKKSGESKAETVGRVIWSGNGVWLATIASRGNGQSQRAPGRYEHHCRNGHAPHQGPCCTGRHRGGDDCGADCCEMD